MENTLAGKEGVASDLHSNGILQETRRNQQEQKGQTIFCNDIRPPDQFAAALCKRHPDDPRAEGSPPSGEARYRFASERRQLVSLRFIVFLCHINPIFNLICVLYWLWLRTCAKSVVYFLLFRITIFSAHCSKKSYPEPASPMRCIIFVASVTRTPPKTVTPLLKSGFG